MKHCILVVEDEQNIVDILSFNLKREGYEVEVALDGAQGLALAQTVDPDLILLDVMIPKLNGFELCKKLRDQGSLVPILMLTAREDEEDKIMGLELGADDYITKPFSMGELLARVKANVRRSTMKGQGQASKQGEARLVLEESSGMVAKDGISIELSQREFDLLCYLAKQPKKVFSREELMEHVWNYEGYVGDVRGVDVAIRRLREKIEDNSANPKFIVTKRGQGYYYGG
ncbi:MAG: response regulator transcription factor [Eubacteriales bacterium]